MRVTSLVSRYFLGLMFTVFGLNGFLHFLKQPPPPTPVAAQWLTASGASHFMVLVFAVQLVSGVLLLSGRFIPLALTMLAPVLVNILNYHLTMAPSGVGPGILALVLWLLAFYPVRASFAPLLKSKTN